MYGDACSHTHDAFAGTCIIHVFVILNSANSYFVHFTRWYCWNSMSLQMCFREISHATLLYSPWRVDLHVWWAMVVLSSSFGGPHPLSAGAQRCSDEICWGGWITWSSSHSTWLSDRSFLSLPRVIKWGFSMSQHVDFCLFKSCIQNPDKALDISCLLILVDMCV